MATKRTPLVSNNIGAVDPREDSRTHKPDESGARVGRASSDFERTNDDGTALSAAQRRSMIRDEFRQEALPSVSEIPGWHLCWLSTTSSYDPIHKRMRLGYTPVGAEELPGFESLRMSSGEFAGAISCNEMILFKIPQEQYQAIMQEFHHHMPLEEEESLRSQLVRETDVDSKGKKLGQITEGSDGYDSLVNKRKVGIFAG